MKILIFGATSSIGKSLIKIFLNDNILFIASSSKSKLKKIEKLYNCNNIKSIELDLSKDMKIDKSFITDFDLIINAACSTSSINDSDINYNKIINHLNVDIINPIKILNEVVNFNKKEKKKTSYIFINTILSKINSPNKAIYSSLKKIHYNYVKKIEFENNDFLNILNVVISTTINKNKISKKSINLARLVKDSFQKGKKECFFGFSGVIIYILDQLIPLLSKIIIYIKRYLKSVFKR